ncbi:MAG: 3'(2'),5'-bisphosphate nucleotidase CysQ [Hyphomicrobiaceae bacterium]
MEFTAAMHDTEHFELAEAILPTVLAAGRVTLKYFAKDVAVELKSDSSPVTIADRESEELILRAISRFWPQIPVIGEESAAAGEQMPREQPSYFLVDPLDGTRDYIAGCQDFTVNVGFVEGGRPVFGIIYQPPTGRLFVTLARSRVIEARVAADTSISRIADLDARQIRTRSANRDKLRVAISKSHHLSSLDSRLKTLGLRDQLAVGSSLKFCLVARGEADIYPRLSSICEWDTAAGHAIVEAAGGRVLGLNGEPLKYGASTGDCRIAPFVAWGDPTLTATYRFN